MNRLLILLATVMLAVPAHAGPSPDQFAFGLPLEVSGEQAVYELELPLAVYRELRRDDLGDLRVFNAAGEVVPHTLRRPASRTRQEEVVTSSLPFFPLAAAVQETDDLAVHVERNAAGSIVDVRTTQRAPAAGPPASYLLDASALRRRIDTLELLWPEATEPFLAELTVETSSDLSRWQTLTTAAVARLSYGAYRLDQNRIRLPRENSAYLRLRWKTGNAPPALLSGVQVLTRKSTAVRLPPRRSLVMETTDAGPGHFRVELPAALPLTAVTIELPERNSLAAVRLTSSAADKGPWRERWRGLAYNLASNGSQLANPEIDLPLSRQRYWELSLETGEASLGAAPRLQFGWQPDRLLFLARGEGPFLLAYGSGAVAPTEFPLEKLLRNASGGVLEPVPVEPGAPVPLAGSGAAAYRPPIPWKKYGLWAALLVGVLLVGGMSVSLYRALRKSTED